MIRPPGGDLVFLWDNVATRDWKAFDATAATGFKVRAPELPWNEGSRCYLVLERRSRTALPRDAHLDIGR